MMDSSNASTDKRGPGHVTLESLLDSPGLTPPSPISEPLTNSVTDMNLLPAMKYNVPSNYFVHPNPVTVPTNLTNAATKCFVNQAERQALLNEVCLELLYIVKEQDVNGYFSFPLPYSNSTKTSGNSKLGLLDIGKQIFMKKYHNLCEFQKDILDLFNSALRHYSVDSSAHNEALRLLTLINDWFSSLSVDMVSNLNSGYEDPALNNNMVNEEMASCDDVSQDIYSIPKETSLRFLNPDNDGIINRIERVQSIGDEVGQLRSGSNLLANGGYREDRRNKVIPYTYLDYGPYYTFGPTYDSGASHCTPEANQLLLSTTWLPARTAYVLGENYLNNVNEMNCENLSITEDLIANVLELGDQQLAVSLSVAYSEQESTKQLAQELDLILPDPNVSEDCVFSMCLANAFTRDILIEEQAKSTVSANSDQNRVENGTIQSDDTNLENEDITPTTCDLDSIDKNDSDQSIKKNVTVSEGGLEDSDLAKSAKDIRALYCAQYLRLGDTTQAANFGSTLRPNSNEISIAQRLARRLVNLAKRARPKDLIHPYTVRRAMGLNPEEFYLPEEINPDANAVHSASSF